MFRLKTLVCCGCYMSGNRKSFLGYNEKRPLFTQCGHPLCSECGKKNEDCPICKKPVKPIENFAARALFEDINKNPVAVFKQWLNAEVGCPEPCSKCFSYKEALYLCIECERELEHLSINYVPNDGIEREDYGQKEEVRLKGERYRKKRCPPFNEFATDIYAFEEKLWRPIFLLDFITVANTALCVDCVLDMDHNHQIQRKPKNIWEMEQVVETLKRSSCWIATKFIFTELEAKKGKCLIRTMRMHRICEKLIHLVVYYFSDQQKKYSEYDLHDRILTVLNKFFKSLGFKNIDSMPMDRANVWVESLENQLKHLENEEKCDCKEVWDQMHKLSFGNQIEKKFVEVIDSFENDVELFECPLRIEEIEGIRSTAIELAKSNLFKIYTAFCWNYERKKVCCIFDDDEHKPCVCKECGAATCMDCLKSNCTNRCSSCGTTVYEEERYRNMYTPREYKVNNQLLELTSFYKTNSVDILEEWWNCEVSKLQFCLSCLSYSDQLEVCAFCELTFRNNTLKAEPPIEVSIQLRQNMPLHFDYSGLEMFPIRWQCSNCANRLQADWMHKYCPETRSEKWKGTWNRGCNHFLTRMYKTKKCSSYDVSADKCEYNAINLKDIGNYEIAMKVATSKLIFTILITGIEENVKCHLRKIEMLNLYGSLKTQTRYYFKKAMAGKEEEEDLVKVKDNIEKTIATLKSIWNQYNPENKECKCKSVWKRASKSLKLKMVGTSKLSLGEECPLDSKHNIDLTEIDGSTEEIVFPWDQQNFS